MNLPVADGPTLTTAFTTPTPTGKSSTASATFDLSRFRGKLVDVWPYAEGVFAADTFPKMWSWLVEEGMLRTVFYEGTRPLTLPGLVRYFDPLLNPGRLLLLATAKSGEGAGFSWFDHVMPGITAYASTFFRRKFWGPAAAEANRIALDYIFAVYRLARVYAITPARNRLAIAHAQRLGFRMVTLAPDMLDYHGGPATAAVLTLARDDFETGGF